MNYLQRTAPAFFFFFFFFPLLFTFFSLYTYFSLLILFFGAVGEYILWCFVPDISVIHASLGNLFNMILFTDGEVHIINLNFRNVLYRKRFDRPIKSIKFSPDGKHFALTKENGGNVCKDPYNEFPCPNLFYCILLCALQYHFFYFLL